MGSVCATIQLQESDLAEIQEETGFAPNQIKRLYHRFSNLDKSNKGFLSKDDLLRIPELAINPLGDRIVHSFFCSEQHNSIDSGEDEEGINFKQFVNVLARFRRAESSKPQPLNSNEHKLDYAFKMYDIDGTQKISKENICEILTLMVGSNKSCEQLAAIADRTISEADEDKDGFINFEEFKKAMAKTDFQQKMSIRFLAWQSFGLYVYERWYNTTSLHQLGKLI